MKLNDAQNLLKASQLVCRVLFAEIEFLSYLYGMCSSRNTRMQFFFEAANSAEFSVLYLNDLDEHSVSVYVRAKLDGSFTSRLRLIFLEDTFNRETLLQIKEKTRNPNSIYEFFKEHCLAKYPSSLYVKG